MIKQRWKQLEKEKCELNSNSNSASSIVWVCKSIWNLDWFLCTGTMKEVDFSSVTLELNAKNLDMKRWSKKWTNVR